MVFSYLMDDDIWAIYENHFMAVTSVLPPEVGHCKCMMSNGLPRVPHFLFPGYMGGDAAREIVEKVYLSNWFRGQTLYGSVAKVETLIHRDPFGAGFDPASRIQSLDVVCVVDQYRQPRLSHPQNDCRHTPYERRYINQARLQSEFQPLLGIVQNKNFRGLKVTFTQRNVRIDVLEEALEAFTDVYQAFKAAAVTIRVQWIYSSDTCGCESGPTHSRNLGKFYIQSRHTWKYRMLQFLERMMPCIESRHIRFVNEPSLGLSDTDFVHRMWDDDETFDPTDDEDSEDDAEETDFDSGSQSEFDSDAI